jgi:hypothetical protein
LAFVRIIIGECGGGRIYNGYIREQEKANKDQHP